MASEKPRFYRGFSLCRIVCEKAAVVLVMEGLWRVGGGLVDDLRLGAADQDAHRNAQPVA